ncbi:ribokinase [Neobacillus sp. 19]|uniref:ribokinase n=1 Tax=Neobacillus sp. 19 TaxID=3394458 RepID=UPI003BF6C2FB
MEKILVVGSLNMDLVTYVPHLPKAGETIDSVKYRENPGGKGANQAVAAARLGGDVTMIGKVGLDNYGDTLIANLKQVGVSSLGIKQEGKTGLAFISVSEDGENHIVLVGGANKELKRSDISGMKELIKESNMIIMQLEIPLDAVVYVLDLAVRYGKKVILNPAPAQSLPIDVLRNVDVLILNEIELQMLTDGLALTNQEIISRGQHLKSLGVNKIIVTMGDRGSYLINDEEEVHIPPYKINPVDSTAAGDAYIAAFAVGKSKGMVDSEAASFASKVAAIVVTREGAQPSLPTLEEVNGFRCFR